MRRVIAGSVFAVGGSVVVASIVFAIGQPYGVIVHAPDGRTQVDLMSLVLAASSLVVTGVGITLAIAAFFGWQVLREAAECAGREAGERAGRTAAEQTALRSLLEARRSLRTEEAEGDAIAGAQLPEGEPD